MPEKNLKKNRTLDLYVRFSEGKVIKKQEEALRFGVDERSIQRDIDDIRAFLADRRSADSVDTRDIIYDRFKKGFVMTGNESAIMTNSEILAVSKILLESRAFTKKEIGQILDKLIAGCVPLKNMKLVSDLIANEKYHYVELANRESIQDKMWQLGMDIKEHNMLEIKYQRVDTASGVVTRLVEPVALLFSEYYFYLNAYMVEREDSGKYVRKYSYPAVFRIDRIKAYKELGEKFRVPYQSRFEEGEFRKRVQFMYSGELCHVQLLYTGPNPEAVLDRLPTAKIRSEGEHEWLIDAEVYGEGILMWLLSQGEYVEVIRPVHLRETMKERLRKMLKKYD